MPIPAVRVLPFLAAVLATAACGRAETPPSETPPAATDSASPAPASRDTAPPAAVQDTTADAALARVAGTWRVAEHRAPGVAAMDQAQADAWVGRAATYDARAAGFEAERCDAPSYTAERAESERYFEIGFRVSPASLDISSDSVDVIPVRCRGADWTAPGSLLIVAGPGRLWTTWDGVFFLLQRER